MKIKNKRLLESLNTAAFLLVLSIIFSDLLHGVLNWLLIKPVLSTIQSSLWADISFIILSALLFILLIKTDYKKSATGYILQGSLVALMIVYLFHRFNGSRYIFTQFSLFPIVYYADFLLLLVLLYIVLLNLRHLKQTEGTISKKSRPAESVIKNYLAQNTNYALLINGKRGTGKTYFMKNTIQPMIDSTLAVGQEPETYKTIFISLYGVKTIDEIYLQLAINIKPYLKHLTVQPGSVLAGILVRGLMNLSGAGSIEEYINDIKSATRGTAHTSNFVMIFDDLDRMSDSFSVNEFIGFVNSMVEHENNKVLIIADELQIEQKELYIAAKEKSIGIVVDFPNDFKASFTEILNERYSVSSKAREALALLEEDILNTFKHWKCDNLRTLIYFLNHYMAISAAIVEQNDEPDLRLAKLKDAAEYCALFCIEFSRGAISFNVPNGVNDFGKVNSYLTTRAQREMFKMRRKQSEQDKTIAEPIIKETPYIETFSQNFKKKGYYFYKSIFDYVTGGDELNKELLSQELQENVTDRIFKPTEEDVVYQKLTYPVVYDLSNEEYIKLSEKLMQFALQGKYPLSRYNEIFNQLTRFPQIKAWSKMKISKQLIEAMHRNRDSYIHDRHTDLHRRHTDRSKYSTYEKAIDETIVEVNNFIGIRDSEARKRNLFTAFSESPENFYEACYNDYIQKPVFTTWDFPAFMDVFNEMKPSAIIEFKGFVNSRYGNMEETGWVEYDFLSNLYNALAYSPEEGRPKNLRQLVLSDLSGVLHDLIRRYYELNPT